MCCNRIINSLIPFQLFVPEVLVLERLDSMLLNTILNSLFQTTFIQNLITHKKLSKPPRKIYYIYPKELDVPPVKWDQLFPEIDVEFVSDIPNYAQFWAEIKRDSLVVLDDLWSSACNSEHISNCFKVYSKKYRFSIAIITQVSSFLL